MAACMTSAAAAVSRTAVKSLKQRATFGTAVKPLRAATPVTATRRAFATTASAEGTREVKRVLRPPRVIDPSLKYLPRDAPTFIC